MEDFFKADGLSRIIFYFQEVENLPDAGTFLESFQGLQSGKGETEGYVGGFKVYMYIYDLYLIHRQRC